MERYTYHVYGLEGLILLECPYYPKPSIDSIQSLSDSNDIFYRSRKTILKFILNQKKALKSQSSPEEEGKSRRHHTS